MSQIEKTDKTITLIVLISDILVINLVYYVFMLFWSGSHGENISMEAIVARFVSFAIAYSISSFFTGTLLYRRRIRVDQVVLISLKNMIGFFLVWVAIMSLYPGINDPITERSLWFFAVVTITTTVLRLVMRYVILHGRRKGRNRCRVVFMGGQSSMQELYGEMVSALTTGYDVLGYFDAQPSVKFSKECAYLGHSKDVIEYIKGNRVDRVYCGLSYVHEDLIVPVINYCESHLIRFYSVPNMRNYLHRRVTLEMFSNVPLLSIRNEPLNSVEKRFIKRTFDIIFSLCFLCTAFPFIFIIVGIVTKITSPGPILFKQKRHGLDGKEFWCYKFRSMKVNADADKLQATEHDPRKTKFGDMLRRTSIDELPQFINVLKGDMSVVGPRPHMLKHTEEYSKMIGTYMVRHLIKPGVTGWAQVTGFRGETKELSEMEGRVKADIWYMEHWTFMLDLYIIYKTIANVLGSKDKAAY